MDTQPQDTSEFTIPSFETLRSDVDSSYTSEQERQDAERPPTTVGKGAIGATHSEQHTPPVEQSTTLGTIEVTGGPFADQLRAGANIVQLRRHTLSAATAETAPADSAINGMHYEQTQEAA